MSPSSPEDGPSESFGGAASAAGAAAAHEPLACLSTFGSEPSRPEQPQGLPRGPAMPWKPLSPNDSPSSRDSAQPGELLGLGQFESLPPFEMIEDLHKIFFATQQQFLPIIHPGNYMRAFHSPPHMRPPMCLQYAIWTAASNAHSKYGLFHDALYRRARQYLEADELKGQGEHFITIGHAQAWAIIASDEARCLRFTRASMSSARSVRLCGMMGLHRLDNPYTEEELPMAPMIAPARSWVELEERRRLFWGTFCMDCYGSISAGWPTLIDVEQVTTHVPVSEDAFINGTEEQSFPLEDAFRSSTYSIFAGNIIICRIFTQLVKHAHRPLPNDRPEDVEFGPFWSRHRELDNMLSSAFMFLPERFRLPRNIRDLNAVQANINLHAAVICLHLAAREKAEKYKLANIAQASQTRSLTAAQEIIDILKASKTTRTGYRGPLMALSLYFSASAYISQAKDNMDNLNRDNLEFIIQWMKATEHQHVITHAYLQQLVRDMESNGISVSVDVDRPNFNIPHDDCGHPIPLIAKMPHTKVQRPLPGRLPLTASRTTIQTHASDAYQPCTNYLSQFFRTEEAEGPANKRARTSAGPGSLGTSAGGVRIGMPEMWAQQMADTIMDPAPDLFEYTGNSWSYTTKYTTNPLTVLPHRTGSPAANRLNTTSLDFDFSMPDPAAGPPSVYSQFDPPGLLASAGFGIHPTNPSTASAAAAAAAAAATTTTTNTNTNTNNTNQSTQVGDTVTGNPPDASANIDLPSGLPDLGEIFSMDQQWTLSESLYAMLGIADSSAAESQDDSLNPWAALNSGSAGAGPAGGGE
ncbi:hypothetical protein C7999DRAFT_39281 [Corynascus novoguineensis]|uniref:Xylanolytic transcriptional activator regulatory domain-containing protein n=1 Tax=Corynascus novoguineensis TaxID=1126955 RepID=A0AAN7HS76_9PEZI|nr:hypothetical protein C7999DRAFT_39281 [Corynascus novoguineensis]